MVERAGSSELKSKGKERDGSNKDYVLKNKKV
jgi:hypothetical protein